MNKEAKIAAYEPLTPMLTGLLSWQNYSISNLANASAMLWAALPEQIFAGFYLYDGEKLILAPFQGAVSCVEIELGKGVCGEAAVQRQTVIVGDVSKRQNYISCDSRAKSEIVVPLIKNDKLIGVLDLDAAVTYFYDEVDAHYLETFATKLIELTDFEFFKVGGDNA